MKNNINKVFVSVVVFFIVVLVLTGTSAYFLIESVKNHEITAMLLLGILFIIAFYSSASLIIRIFQLRFQIKLASELEERRNTTVKELAEHFNKSTKQIDTNIMKLIKGEYIAGFYYDHRMIEKIEDRNRRLSEKERVISEQEAKEVEAKQKVLQQELREKEKLTSGRCAYCGANVVFRGKDTVCPYCGNLIVAK